jgi:hypothetical protein
MRPNCRSKNQRVTPLPPGDYYAVVSRRQQRPAGKIYHWAVRDRLPTIALSLKVGDPDVPLDLQAAFTTVFGRARYGLSLNYDIDPEPPLGEEDAKWARGCSIRDCWSAIVRPFRPRFLAQRPSH